MVDTIINSILQMNDRVEERKLTFNLIFLS